MSGFGIYETLRILVPGWFAVAFLDLGIRMAIGTTPFQLTEEAATVVNFIEDPLVGLGMALVAGLLLYAMDLPTKTGVYILGDPDNEQEPPSRHLKMMLSNNKLRERSISLYFLLQDEYMSQEAHRKVYLFGSFYRIFVDLRILAAFSFVFAVVVGLTAGEAGPQGLHIGWLLLVVFVWIAPYVYDFGQHAINSVRKYEDSLADFIARRRSEASIWPVVAMLLAINFLAAALSLLEGAHLAGVLLAVAGLGLWLRLEMGSPDVQKWAGIWWWLARQSGVADQRVFTTHQRALLDLGAFLPWVIAASTLTAIRQQPDAWVLAWLAFLIPLSVVLGYHKHEDRLRNSFGDQNTWIDVHASEIAEIDRRGQMPVTWWESSE